MPGTLARTLGLHDLILIVVGTVIGSGIFLVPGAVLRECGGDPGIALVVWVVAGILSLLGALTYGELGAAHPAAGGLYVYVRDAFGTLPAFLYGWTLLLMIGSGSAATLAVAFSNYAAVFVRLSPVAGKLVAMLMLALVAAVNVRGTRHSATLQNWSTALKVAAILALSAVLLATGGGLPAAWAKSFSAPVTPSLVSGAGLATIAVLWAYEGWQYVTYSAGETLDPARVFPRGIVRGTTLVIAVYLLANLGYLAGLGPEAAARSDRVAADAAGVALGGAAGKLIAAAVLVSVFSAANGITLTASR